jgi:L-rhamnose mutarotase
VDKYKEVHAAVWPEVLKQIKDCNIQDCTLTRPRTDSNLKTVCWVYTDSTDSAAADSIFHDPETGILFASFKYVGYDYAGDMERMRENPKVREWWRMTDGMQESLVPGAKDSESGEPSWWKPIEEVFYTP